MTRPLPLSSACMLALSLHWLATGYILGMYRDYWLCQCMACSIDEEADHHARRVDLFGRENWASHSPLPGMRIPDVGGLEVDDR